MELLQSEFKLCDMCHERWTKLRTVVEFCYKCKRKHSFGRRICETCLRQLIANRKA